MQTLPLVKSPREASIGNYKKDNFYNIKTRFPDIKITVTE